VLLLAASVGPRPAAGVQLEALAAREWRVGELDFAGNHALTHARLRRAMVTKARPWYEAWRVWRPLPTFDPVTFRDDLQRLRQLYRNEGYYDAVVHHDIELPAEGTVLRVVVYVREGPPVYVEEVCVELRGVELAPEARRLLLANLPVERGRVFREDDYARATVYLRTYYREHGFARVVVTPAAEVDVRRDAVTVRYDVDSGPPSVFGAVEVSGAATVGEDVVRREVAFEPGQPFKQSRVDQSRQNLIGLRLFRSVRIDEDEERDADVDTHVRVVEGPSREVRLGVGYETEEQIRGLAAWRDYDFFGDARQLGFSARASLLRRTIAADFLQPHFPRRGDRVRLLLFEQQEDEDTYDNDRSRLSPRIEWQVQPTLVPYAFYRIEYDSLSDVDARIRRLVPDIAPPNGVLSGLGAGVDWNATDDLLDPLRGWAANASVEPVGDFLGGDFAFLRSNLEGRRYQPLVADLSAALRLRVAAADPIGGGEVPLFERFYAGGINSVRGYDRRRVAEALEPPAPRPAGAPPETPAMRRRRVLRAQRRALAGDPLITLINDKPIGGRSLVETSIELRHPITEKLGGAVFLDAGQVSRDSYDFPFDALKYGTGLGVRYQSPVGPIRLDLGFPLDPPPGDPFWQVHVSIGRAF
jgi:outer membrane protein insertion porin family/translocation and assembly module TamA